MALTQQADGALALAAFLDRVRANGIRIPPNRAVDLALAIDALGPQAQPSHLRLAGRATLCSTKEEVEVYDRLTGAAAPRAAPPGIGLTAAMGAAKEAADVTTPDGAAGLHPSPRLVAASEQERLRRLSARDATDSDLAALRRLMSTARLPARWRRQTRRHLAAHRGSIDRIRYRRAMLRAGGEPVPMRRRRVQRDPRRVVLLVDVSASMEPFIDLYLRLGHALVRSPIPAEVFTIGTRLTLVTAALDHRDVDHVSAQIAAQVLDRSGGTRLGDGLARFIELGRRGAARGAVVLVLSDGWERGETRLLERSVHQISLLAHQLWWGSPWAGEPNFIPSVGGLRAAIRHCDGLVPAASLFDIEQIIDLLVVSSAQALARA
ncbi:MAG: VWA domain-containing protein [Actinomycetota bacterium]|nr:VWA domain-containing protein [Actinomycetota bacterium]